MTSPVGQATKQVSKVAFRSAMQGTLALVLTLAAIYLYATGGTIPDVLIALWSTSVGSFYAATATKNGRDSA